MLAHPTPDPQASRCVVLSVDEYPGLSEAACMQVYILGVSHISRESCQEIQDLIQTVRPEVLILELCKDRLRLLLDQVWQTPQLTLSL